MIELTQQEARTGDALRAKGQIIATVQQWKRMILDNEWILDEWDDEFKNWLRPILDSVELTLQQLVTQQQ